MSSTNKSPINPPTRGTGYSRVSVYQDAPNGDHTALMSIYTSNGISKVTMAKDLGQAEVREYTVVDEIREFSKTRIFIRCPFCEVEVWAYVWSLCSTGKKCPHCGALHMAQGVSVKKPPKERAKRETKK